MFVGVILLYAVHCVLQDIEIDTCKVSSILKFLIEKIPCWIINLILVTIMEVVDQPIAFSQAANYLIVVTWKCKKDLRH